MSDNLKLKARDSKTISMKEPWEVRDWCDHFGCTKAALEAAVVLVGHSAKAVREHFEKNPHAKNK